jgi:hypothetical protein
MSDIPEKNQRYREIAGKIMEFMRLSLTWGMSPEVLDSTWNEIAVNLFRLQAEFVQPYKNLCKYRFKTEVSNIRIDNFRQIPVMPTTAFKEFEITALTNEERSHVFYSSGTTYEKPSRHFHSEFSLKLYEESLKLWFSHCIIKGLKRKMSLSGKNQIISNQNPEDTSQCKFNFIFLTPPPEIVPHSSLVHMFKTLNAEYGIDDSTFYGIAESQTSWRIDYNKLLNKLNSITCESAPIICGTAFNYVHLIEYFEESGIRFNLPPNTVIFETGGYKGRSREIPKHELYRKIARIFGISEDRIVSEYGMSELSSQAYDKLLSDDTNVIRKYRFPPWAKFSIVSPETKEPVGINEIGILRIYDLANVYSVFAIQTDDLAVNLGDGFMLYGRAGAAESRGCSLLIND